MKNRIQTYSHVLEILNLHNAAQNKAWSFVFKKLKNHPELINSVCPTTDSTLATIAARQGDLTILSKLKEMGMDIELTTPSGITLEYAALNITELYTRIKTAAWVNGNLTNNSNHNFSSFAI